MDSILTLILSSLLSFFLAWVLSSLRSQRNNQQMHNALEIAKSEFERIKLEIQEQDEKFNAITIVKNNLDVAYGRLEAECENQRSENIRLKKEFALSQERVELSLKNEQQARESFARAEATATRLQSQLENTENWWKQAKDDLKLLEEKHSALNNEYSKIKTSLEEKQNHFDEQLKLLQNSKDALKKEFENLASDILERKGKAFKELNQESIANLLSPIQTEMKGFRTKVEELHSKDAEQRIQLTTELKHLQSLNKEITEQADKLATALQGQKKIQGNWGELILENVLDNSGLRIGVDYKREVSITTDEGRQRPDAIVYLPQNQHLVIDAKTSLVAYTEYMNSDNEITRMQALATHTKAVSDRINELSDKNYFRLPGLNSPEVVIMFIPIESAYVEALKYDETLFQRAIERNVLVATPTTLLTSLNIVRQLWRFEDQNKHTAELADRAEKFYNKLNSFLGSMQAIGTQLDKARASYDKAFGQLYNGKGNLIKQASEFKDLGVSVLKELPVELVDQANLELDNSINANEEAVMLIS